MLSRISSFDWNFCFEPQAISQTVGIEKACFAGSVCLLGLGSLPALREPLTRYHFSCVSLAKHRTFNEIQKKHLNSALTVKF